MNGIYLNISKLQNYLDFFGKLSGLHTNKEVNDY